MLVSHLGEVQHYFQGKTDSEIKGYISQKLQNESKRLRKKPLPLSTKEEEQVRRGGFDHLRLDAIKQLVKLRVQALNTSQSIE